MFYKSVTSPFIIACMDMYGKYNSSPRLLCVNVDRQIDSVSLSLTHTLPFIERKLEETTI